MKHNEVSPLLDTPAEKSLGKEINMVNGKDFNHLDLIIEAKNNRLKAEFFYIYDYDKFNNCSLLKPNFDIFDAPNGINHTSARYVIHYLTKELKKRFKEIDRTSKSSKTSLYDVFKPSLGQFDDQDIAQANAFIRKMFPYEGCTYTGAKLEQIIDKVTWITLLLALRIIWSLLPGAIIPWESFKKFQKKEELENYKNVQSFYQTLPIFMPSHNHCCVLFEFLEIFIAIFCDDYFIDLNIATDLIFTAGQICLNRDEFKEPESQNDDDLNELQKFYYNRGASFYQIFIAYLRALSQEPSFEFKALLDVFKIEEYPPKPYKPLTQKALTLTVPSDPELVTTNYFKLISNASNATSRIYSSNYTFTKFENKFLDKFEINPHKIIEHFFSKSSKNYLLKFDKTLDFDNFKVNSEVSDLRKNLKNGTGLFDNKDFVSTFINEFNRYGFESKHDNKNNSETFIADTINFNFNSSMENVDLLPVRVSKLEISEWFINAWKYETFLGYLQNTVVLKLTKTIGDCDWLIITSHDKVSSHNRYLTPPSSAEMPYDTKKDSELGGGLKDEVLEDRTSAEPKRSLLSPAFAKKPSAPPTPKIPEKPSSGSSSKLSTPKSKEKATKRISFPSPPRDIADFERQSREKNGDKPMESHLAPNKKVTERKKPLVSPTKPLPAPVIPNQRIHTPNQQLTEAWTPPPLLRNANNENSLISAVSESDSTELIAAQLEFKSPTQQVKVVSSENMKSGKISASSPSATGDKLQQLQISDEQKPQKLINDSAPPAKPLVASSTYSTPKGALPDLESPFIAPSGDLSEAVESGNIHTDEPKETVAKEAHPYLRISPARPPREVTSRSVSVPHQPNLSVLRSIDSPVLDRKNESVTSPSFATSHYETPTFEASPAFATAIATTNTEKKSRRLSKLNIPGFGAQNIVKSSINSPLSATLPKFSFFGRKASSDALNRLPSSESTGSLAHINDESSPNRRLSILENNPELAIASDLSIPEIPYTPQSLKSRTSSHSLKNSSRELSTSTLDAKSPAPKDDLRQSESLEEVISQNRGGFVRDYKKDEKDVESLDSTDDNDIFDSHCDTSEFTQEISKTPAHNKELSMDLNGLLEEIGETQSFFNADDFISSKATDAGSTKT